MHETRDRRNLFRDVLQENKEMIARPAITLVPSVFSFFSLPLFIVAFSLECQNLEHSSLRYLLIVFYFLTFIPPIFTFVLYIYPSSFYWKEWQTTCIGQRIAAFRQTHSPNNSTVLLIAKKATKRKPVHDLSAMHEASNIYSSTNEAR